MELVGVAAVVFEGIVRVLCSEGLVVEFVAFSSAGFASTLIDGVMLGPETSDSGFELNASCVVSWS